MKLFDAVQEIIRLGDASRVYWDRELPRHHPHYPLVRPEDVPVPAPPEELQIESLLKGLPDDQLYALLLLMYVGRGDFQADDPRRAHQHMREAFPSRDLVIVQMLNHKSLAEYLTDGLEELQKHHIGLDQIQRLDQAVPAS